MSFEWCLKFAAVIAASGWLTIADSSAQPRSIAGLTRSAYSGSTNAPQPEPPEALILPNASQLTLLDEAYLDAFSILKADNACSDFYGGPPAVEVLNQLKRQLKPEHLDSSVAVRMTGKTGIFVSLPYLLSYRLFEKAALNREGLFYSRNAAHANRSLGGSLSNMREARVTILLHELGHLIRRKNKQWLLPDDGGNEYLSQENSKRVLAVCGNQIRTLSRISFTQELQPARPASPGLGTSAAVLDAKQP